MRSCPQFAAFALMAGLICVPGASLAQESSSSNYKVLASDQAGLNVSTVQSYIDKGDSFVSRGDLVKARESFDQARAIAKQLLGFYRDLNGAFRGLDARIPREMDGKGREALSLLAESNLRLAALFRKQDQPEVAVPLLVEVVRLMSPTNPQGQKAYQGLLELGFVNTPFAGGRR